MANWNGGIFTSSSSFCLHACAISVFGIVTISWQLRWGAKAALWLWNRDDNSGFDKVMFNSTRRKEAFTLGTQHMTGALFQTCIDRHKVHTI